MYHAHELVDTASRVYDPTETCIFVADACPAREGFLRSQDRLFHLSRSALPRFRYGSSCNKFSVNSTLDRYSGKLAASKSSFNHVWETSDRQTAVQAKGIS